MNELTDERLAELCKIAGAATPGAWTADGMAGDLDSPECRVAEVGMWREVDAEHIATFDPPTVLALLDRIAELQRRIDDMEALARNGIGKLYNRTLDKIILAARGER